MGMITGAETLIKALEYQEVDTAFGIPGGAILPAYDPLIDAGFRHVLARHEQGAGHMAEGYAWATGKVGVAIATSGPGATNLVTPLADALMDSVPIVAITGQVPTHAVGNDAFQEAHTTGITMPATKHNYFVTHAEEIAQTVAEAFHLASTGRPGPVLVDIPKDVLNARVPWRDPEPVAMPGYRPTTSPHPRRIREAIRLIESAERPVLYVGGGIIKAGGSEALAAFARMTNMPVITTLMGRGAISDHNPNTLGMPGMHGLYAATTAMQKADLLVAIGVRFDDRVTGDPDAFAPFAKVIHADIDPAEIGKVRAPEVPIVGDARLILEAMCERWGDTPTPELEKWWTTIRTWQERHPLRFDQQVDGPLKPQHVISRLRDRADDDAIVVSGVGQHQMWASQYWRFDQPRHWINSGGLGTMGFAVPAAIGAKAGMPDQQVIAVDGDGCFQMTVQELITAAYERIPIKVALFNNAAHGMVRQWQRLFYNERFSASDLGQQLPDYPKLAESMGCAGLRATRVDEVDHVIETMLEIDDRPVVAEFVVDRDEMVFPMVPAGGSNDIVLNGPEDL